jgi:multidrug resistance protein, MATE family
MPGLEVQPELADSRAGNAWLERLRTLGPEFGPTLKLAAPVVLSELGWMLMGIVDTIMVGRLGPAAIGAVSLGNIFYYTATVFGIGILLGLDTLVSQSFGAGDLPSCRRALRQGLFLVLVMAPPLMILIALAGVGLRFWGIDPAVLRLAQPYMKTIVWELPTLLTFITVRRYLQAMNVVRPVMWILFSANVVNFAGNWLLIEGHWGLPALGVVGSACSTVCASFFMVSALAAVAIHHGRGGRMGTPPGWRPDFVVMRRLIGLGLPTAIQITLELGVFAIAAALAGGFGEVPLAAHQIALTACALTFMVPLGVSSAGAVRVGQALGRRDLVGATRAGWTALIVGAGFMLTAGVTFLLVPRSIGRVFSSEPAVLGTVVLLLAVGAVFQLFDGVQVVASGILRGAGETRWPMVCTVVAHWLIGLPIGYVLGVTLAWGVFGIWIGLSAGLIAAGFLLLAVWIRRSGRMEPIESLAPVPLHLH